MTVLQAVVLGLVQGATEFLPVSSSGHLVVVPRLLGWRDQGLAFDAAVHLGTALALVAYFARELHQLARGLRRGARGDRRLALAVVVGTLPAAAAGLAFERTVETHLRAPAVVALSTILWALVLWWADRRAARARVHDLRAVDPGRALAVGLAQALALVPGTSRSGITLSVGLLAGLDRSTAARFAFLLGLPLTAGAGLLKALALARAGLAHGQLAPLAAGIGTSFGAGLLAIWFLVGYVRRRTLTPFVVYRLVLGVAVLWLAAR
jgi:undecaprenyl-diphosphatase